MSPDLIKPLTVLIGGNACGKSSILQAIQLIMSLVQTDLDHYIKNRNWAIKDIKSQLSNKNNITLKTTFEFHSQEGQTNEIQWEFVFNPVIKEEKIYIRSEKVINLTTTELLLRVNSQGIMRYNAKKKERELIPPLNLAGSFIKNVDESKDISTYPFLVQIKKFFLESDAFDLLLPGKLSQSSRGKVNSIGYNGEKIAAFIHGLNQNQKKRVEDRLKRYSGFVSTVQTQQKNKKLGWVNLSVLEHFTNHQTHIKSEQLSDGILRIIAIASIAEISDKRE